MQPNIPRISVFDENDPKYRCCCGCMSVRTGSIIIATLNVLTLLGMIWNLLSALALVNSNPSASSRFGVTLVFVLFETIAVCCLIHALRTERPKFVKPQIYVNVLYIIFQLIALVVVLVAVIAGSDFVEILLEDLRRQKGRTGPSDDIYTANIGAVRRFVIILTILILSINIAVASWFMRTLMAYYVYLSDKLAFTTNSEGIDGYWNGMEPMMRQQPHDGMGMQTKPPAYHELMKPGMTAYQETAYMNQN